MGKAVVVYKGKYGLFARTYKSKSTAAKSVRALRAHGVRAVKAIASSVGKRRKRA